MSHDQALVMPNQPVAYQLTQLPTVSLLAAMQQHSSTFFNLLRQYASSCASLHASTLWTSHYMQFHDGQV